MKSFCQLLCCAIFCCKCSKVNPLKNIDEDTRLLPKNQRTRAILEKNEIHSYGLIPENLRGQIIDISQFTKSLVKKIVCGTNHCIILFNDGQLAGFGSNEEGQLGFDIKKEGKYLNEIRINKFNFTDPETGQIIDDYQISDIGTGDNFSLILVRSGINRYFLIKFGINAEERYLEDSENIKTINTLNIDYEKIKTISKIFVFGQRSLILTNDDKLFVGGVNFEMKPLSKFKFLHELSRRITGVYLGLGHCLITDFEGNVYAIGDNTFGELGLQNEMQVEKFTKLSLKFKANIKKIAVGARHTLILLDNYELYAFGDNSEGQCTGQNARYSYPTKVEIEAKEKIVDIYCGYNHNLIVLSNGEMLSWGDTSSGKLGYIENNMIQVVPKTIQVLKGKYPNIVALGFQMTVISTSPYENSICHDFLNNQ